MLRLFRRNITHGLGVRGFKPAVRQLISRASMLFCRRTWRPVALPGLHAEPRVWRLISGLTNAGYSGQGACADRAL